MSEKADGKVNLKLNNPYFRNKDGFILYYSPNCPHCVNFAPTYKELARRLKGACALGTVNCNDTLNGSNLLADFMSISGLPTLKFYNHLSGEYIDYTGGRTVVELLEFLCKVKNLCDL
jgi:thiol-disulfide isomerase/thioredoxin